MCIHRYSSLSSCKQSNRFIENMYRRPPFPQMPSLTGGMTVVRASLVFVKNKHCAACIRFTQVYEPQKNRFSLLI